MIISRSCLRLKFHTFVKTEKDQCCDFWNASVQVEDHFVALKGALILLLENICDPILNTYGLYEGYAWKNGEQGTGTLTGLMNFISKIQFECLKQMGMPCGRATSTKNGRTTRTGEP